MSGKLFVVPTPIGNLEDMTIRAINTLKEVDLIFAEDTRNTIFLLKHFNIEKPVRSYHMHNEHKILEEAVKMISNGQNVALVSDAGTPGISDPGFLLIRESIKQNIEVTTLPGATAFVPALVSSGFPCDTFVFYGFLPQKKGRQTKLKQLANEERTFILYESPFRLVKLLEELKEYLGDVRRACVSREISKLYEENKRGTFAELITYFSAKQVKGEIVVTIEAINNGKETEE
ncbi:MAG: 16S rRNA (cytidine(1402)-2'-O)-methyltransferase [Sphingobacteriaceae bacterium]|nr:16S rRNA (cytidine(1402)-2'-O)-methyltransferase [Sphingobacteriaceae bacterium]